jgi:hypothetical protein
MREGRAEPAIVTAGNEFADVGRLVADGAAGYAAADVVRYLRGAEERSSVGV